MTVAPKKALGQHFLVDENILGVIERLGDLRSTDVVLEVGPGLGILTRRLAERARFVHSIELDRSLEPELRAALGEYANVRLVWGDALQLAIDELEPHPPSSSPTSRTTSRLRSWSSHSSTHRHCSAGA